MRFAKLHGAGNDFILVTEADLAGQDPSMLARRVCHRRFGVGADGLMVAMGSSQADIRMHYLNSDGSVAEMCGNGIRCFSRFVFEEGLVQGNAFTVETLAGVKPVVLTGTGESTRVRVSMGAPGLLASEVPARVDTPRLWDYPAEAAGRTYRLYAVRMGVPHTVVFVDAIEGAVTEAAGPVIENLAVFPERTNVNFVQVTAPNRMRVDTWERGAGHTWACGTGVCASVHLAHELGHVGPRVEVETLGGALTITLQNGEVIMEGEASWICTGEFQL